jgi:hypothetical protein
VYREGSA